MKKRRALKSYYITRYFSSVVAGNAPPLARGPRADFSGLRRCVKRSIIEFQRKRKNASENRLGKSVSMTDSRSRRKCEIQETGLFVANPIRSAKREFVVRAFFAVPLSCILITLSFSSTFQRLSKFFFRLLCNVPKRMPREPFGPFSGQGSPLLFHRFLPLPKDSSGVLHMKRKTQKTKLLN